MGNDITRPIAGSIEIRGIADVLTLATHLAKAKGFVPRALLGDPGSIAAAILTGLELGMGPMEAMRSLHVIDGRTTMSAELMLSRAIARGVRHQWLETTATVARIRLERDGSRPFDLAYTIEDAQTAGLARKDNWRGHPKAMLRARCISAALRAYCPDVLGSGIYTPEELGEVTADAVVDRPPAGALLAESDGGALHSTQLDPDRAARVEAARERVEDRNAPQRIADLMTAEEVCEYVTPRRDALRARPQALDGLLRRAGEIGVSERDVRAWLAGNEPQAEEPPMPEDGGDYDKPPVGHPGEP